MMSMYSIYTVLPTSPLLVATKNLLKRTHKRQDPVGTGHPETKGRRGRLLETRTDLPFIPISMFHPADSLRFPLVVGYVPI
jgi:hypothetical protein